MQICKYANMQICKYVNIWLCKYVNMQICKYVNKKCIEVNTWINMFVTNSKEITNMSIWMNVYLCAYVCVHLLQGECGVCVCVL